MREGGRKLNLRGTVFAYGALILICALGCQGESKVAAQPLVSTPPAATTPPPVAAPDVVLSRAPEPSIHKIWQDTDEELVKDGITFHMTIQRDLREDGTETSCIKLVVNRAQDSSGNVEFVIKLAGGYAIRDKHLICYKGEVTNSSIKIQGVEKSESELPDEGKTVFQAMKDGVNKTVDFHIDKVTEDTLVLSEKKDIYLYRAIDESQLLLK